MDKLSWGYELLLLPEYLWDLSWNGCFFNSGYDLWNYAFEEYGSGGVMPIKDGKKKKEEGKVGDCAERKLQKLWQLQRPQSSALLLIFYFLLDWELINVEYKLMRFLRIDFILFLGAQKANDKGHHLFHNRKDFNSSFFKYISLSIWRCIALKDVLVEEYNVG